MSRVLVTGATGFVGRALCETLARSGFDVRAAVRSPAQRDIAGTPITVGEIGADTDWGRALDGVSTVIHTAARAHELRDAEKSASMYLDTNAHGTRCLAEQAARAGVRRFLYLSSVKVNGEETDARAYTAADEPHPQDVYGKSKWLGEQELLATSAATKMESVIVRSPIVYGPGVKANFLRLLRWVDKQWPLPLGAVRNRRSLVSLWNLIDLMIVLSTHPRAAGRIWMVSDGEDLSTADLIRRLARAMDRRSVLLPVPVAALKCVARLSGHGGEVARLCGSLQVDLSATRELLGWSPPCSLDEGVLRTVRWYLGGRAHVA